MRDFDLVVVGAGVAGLTAAMFAARYGLAVVVVDQIGVGGQIINAERIENFPGFPNPLGGHELGPLLHEQAEAAGAEFLLDTVAGIEATGTHHIVHGAGETLRARAVIIAAGSALRPLGIAGEDKLIGRGVSHCAACDGAFFKGHEVGVVGGGDSALDEALLLTAHASRVPRQDRDRAQHLGRGDRRRGCRHRRAPARHEDRQHAPPGHQRCLRLCRPGAQYRFPARRARARRRRPHRD
jgi:thioredoxin reductase (NADPH)